LNSDVVVSEIERFALFITDEFDAVFCGWGYIFNVLTVFALPAYCIHALAFAMLMNRIGKNRYFGHIIAVLPTVWIVA
jgi:hypothetical protein